MSNALSPFIFESHDVRIEMVDDVPWFRAGDIAASIGLTGSAGRDSLRRLEDGDRMLLTIESTPGGQGRAVSFVSEPGMYDMVMDGRKPSAKRFRRWVTSEVLPTIRKTGRYEMAPESLEQRSLALITELSSVVANQEATIASQGARITAQAPRVAFAVRVEASQWERTPTEVFQLLGIDQRKGFAWFRTSGTARKTWISVKRATGEERGRSQIWKPYASAMTTGRFTFRERPWVNGEGSSSQMMITPKGAIWLTQSMPADVYKKGRGVLDALGLALEMDRAQKFEQRELALAEGLTQ